MITWAVRTVERLVALDAERGARASLPAVRAALRSLPAPAAAPTRDELAALAELYEVAGWILFDAGRYGAAHRMNARALDLAGRGGDRWTARFVLLNHSMLKAHTGEPGSALDAAARTAGARPLPARVGSLVLVRQAHAIAMLGGRTESTALISRAHSRFQDGISRHDPHWAWWFDETELIGHQGWVHARLHDWDRALPLLHRAATAPGPAYRKLFTAQLLAAFAGAGAWRDAGDLIERIAPDAARIGSVRTTETLGRTAALLLRRTDVPPALRDAAAHLLECLPRGQRDPAA
ncbi:DNA-binding protein [Streptomyces sp. NPDC050658]|uniref:DNA-binding protein n=1 Tax=unclassified Streptomyces TaxID=2593676 RepID=UPI00343350A6